MFFTWNVKKDNGVIEEVELCEDGANVPITEENKHEFIAKVIDLITYTSNKNKIDHLISGFRSLLPLEILMIFTPQELDFIISGQNCIDINDWKQHSTYKGTYHENHYVLVELFNFR